MQEYLEACDSLDSSIVHAKPFDWLVWRQEILKVKEFRIARPRQRPANKIRFRKLRTQAWIAEHDSKPGIRRLARGSLASTF